jgi:hypothetical protein
MMNNFLMSSILFLPIPYLLTSYYINKLEMLGKIILGGAASVTVAAVAIPPFRRKLDRNVLRPIRDYNQHLKSWNDFRTEVLINHLLQEEFIEFVQDLGRGVTNMFRIEE